MLFGHCCNPDFVLYSAMRELMYLVKKYINNSFLSAEISRVGEGLPLDAAEVVEPEAPLSGLRERSSGQRALAA